MEKKYNFVYLITNIIDGKQYIGDHSTNNENLDKYYLGSGRPYLTNAFHAHGKKNFKRVILEFFPSKDEAFKAQEKYIQKYNTLAPNGYNISPKGGHGVNGCMSEETKEKIRVKNTGKKRSEETREKQRQKKLGTKRSEEAKRKTSETFQINGSKKKEKHHMWGKNLSESHKKALVTSRIGHKTIYSEESKKQMSASAQKRKGTQFWITNNTINKKINIDDINEWINLGWHRGRNKK